ncbi:peptide/nickel transport system ATP-binding protein [Kaistia soli DSM 19436]|uniref:Peptide/nickel transport system ATP-binding protein n=1 Tax=Kaistia soli DSM 19436 TaxID=1122133 RepID=A0A1M4U0F9_9HYPH|nr:ABC transporter ATP-binding protein [Kaistia soli]SHE50189.1 peptide/nickel transport system ATP-binding protein [Kaistia soli DSM 19436]
MNDMTPTNLSGSMPLAAPFVRVKDLRVRFVSREATVRAVNGVTFDLARGEVLCVIGESGSGKSVMMRSLLRLHPKKRTVIEGSMQVGEHDIGAVSDRVLSKLRGSTISMIFQEPMTALDPLYTIGDQIVETVRRHEGLGREAAWARALELLELVRVPSPERRLKAYPHELSGGLRQRAMIAVALSCRPSLLLADEPTTALDASVQIQVLVLLRKLQREMEMSMIFVTHDLGVAAQIADKVAVMYAGRIIEYGTVADVLNRPQHPYTRAMLASTVKDQERGVQLEAIAGSPPDLRALPDGCSFLPRCGYAKPECAVAMPPETVDARGHMARCYRVGVEGQRLAFSAPAIQPSVCTNASQLAAARAEMLGRQA